MSTFRPRRSMLYMPGSNARALEKAKTLAADALIFDLEDAVAPDAKDMARHQVMQAVKAGGYGRSEVMIRVNAFHTSWGREDLNAAAEAHPDAILVPKVESAVDIFSLGALLEDMAVPPSLGLWVMIETPRAVQFATEIAAARAHPHGLRLRGFVLGTNDIAKETRARLVPGRLPMLNWLSTAVLAARTQGLDIIDGVYNDFKDLAGFRAECAQGRDLGMDGKTLIHPDQIAIANEIFAPSQEEIAYARRLIAAFAAPDAEGKGALQLDGRMVERMHAEMAERTVRIAEAIGVGG